MCLSELGKFCNATEMACVVCIAGDWVWGISQIGTLKVVLGL